MSFLNPTFLFISVLFVLLAGCSHAPPPEALHSFVEALEAFEKAEKLPQEKQPEAFRHVAARFQSLAEHGTKSGSIYYNAGNAWFRGEEPGKALAAYLVARRYMPLDPHIASNLQTVLGRSAATEPPTPVIEHLFFWQNWIGVRQKALISFQLAVVTGLCGAVSLFVRHRRLRRFTLVLLALALISIASTGYDWYRFELLRNAVVSSEQAMPRKGNSEQYELSFTTPVSFGTTATIEDERGDWVLLRFGSGREGWLPKKQIVEF